MLNLNLLRIMNIPWKIEGNKMKNKGSTFEYK